MFEAIETASSRKITRHVVSFVNDSIGQIVVFASPAPEFIAETVNLFELPAPNGKYATSVASIRFPVWEFHGLNNKFIPNTLDYVLFLSEPNF